MLPGSLLMKSLTLRLSSLIILVFMPGHRPRTTIAQGRAAGLADEYKIMAGRQKGVDASEKINHCIATVIAAGGGWCDASDIAGNQTISEEIDVGNDSGVAVYLTLPAAGVWSTTINDPNKYAVKVYQAAIVYGPHNAGLGTFQITSSPGSHVKSLLATDPAGGREGSSYIMIEGITVRDPAHAVSPNGAVIEIQNIFDLSRFNELYADNFFGKGIWIHNVCCGSTFSNIGANGGANPGALPCVIGGVGRTRISSVTINGLSCVHPGSGKNALLLDWASNQSSSAALVILGIHLEEELTQPPDNATSYISINGLTGVHIIGAHLVSQADSGTRYVVEISPQSTGLDQQIVLEDISSFADDAGLVNDRINKKQMIGRYLPKYVVGPRKAPSEVIQGTLAVKRTESSTGTALTPKDFSLAGWGRGAEVHPNGSDSAFTLQITAGTATSINPTAALIFRDGSWRNTPVCVGLRSDGNDPAGNLWEISAQSATSITLLFRGQPIPNRTYSVNMRCEGK
jgi:hypothetical protein